MNMWAVSAMPVYSVEPDTRRKGGKKSSISKTASSLGFPAKIHHLHQQPQAHGHDPDALSSFFEPAIDGPPSPESIRAQMKRAANANAQEKEKHQSHQTTSSGSSSLRSLTSTDRPSWENALDGLTLSRKSSGRSTSSSMPSRERPESVQIFGKTIFNRRGKFRRESSAQSSLYSGELSTDALVPSAQTSAPSRDSTIPAFFSRRRAASRAEPVDETGPARKFQISEPYNFQHVAHTQKDHVPELQRSSRVPSGGEYSHHVRGSHSSRGGRADDMHFADFSSDNLPLSEEDESTLPPEPHTRINLNRPPSMLQKHTSPQRRLVKHTQSQDHLRIPPPRPPRSPIEQAFVATPPIPPPRISSRTSMRSDEYDPLANGSIDRPHTAGGFRHPQPLNFGSDASLSPPSTSHSYLPASDMDAIPEHSHARFSSTPNDANWPLPCSTTVSFDSTLPQVPEEEEGAFVSRRSRTSMASISSLRGSQSVPMLRMSGSHEDGSRRRSSGASETLGRLDMLAAQRALRAALEEGNSGEPLPRESWEDDIDYCYEHAAEADCDYAWERPSLELNRESDSVTPVEGQDRRIPSCEVSPTMLTPAQFDVPALSPASQVSSVAGAEAITPTVYGPPRASNFSLPRTDVPKSNLLHVRKPSDASSFKESHGFTLSPSLLIPQDFQQQMIANEAEIVNSRESSYHQYEESGGLGMDMSAVIAQNRVSASTTGTVESTRSGFERHASTASTSTDFTRLTMSTSSLEMEGYLPGSEPLHRFPSFESSKVEGKASMPTVSENEEMTGELSPAPRPQFMSHGSDPNLVAKMTTDEPSTHKRKESFQARRGRARTTSLTTPPPPNQYALFPSVHMSGARI
ncbi:hypothetical protein V8F20_008492 [Naviculisporaceae sp. PSN 640]